MLGPYGGPLLVELLGGCPTPITRQVTGRGPPPQLLRKPGQPLVERPTNSPSCWPPWSGPPVVPLGNDLTGGDLEHDRAEEFDAVPSGRQGAAEVRSTVAQSYAGPTPSVSADWMAVNPGVEHIPRFL